VVKVFSQPYIVVDQQLKSSNRSNAGEGEDQYALARNQSFGFFYDITDAHWMLYRQKYLEHVNHRFPDLPWVYHPDSERDESLPHIYPGKFGKWAYGWASYKAWYQNNYEPNFSCQFEKRVGIPMNGDGAKWVCDPHRIKVLAEARKAKDPNHPGCVVYSIGSSGNFDFELGLEKEIGAGVCEIHIFDFGNYESKMKQSGLKNAHYHRWGLDKQNPYAKNPPSPTEKYDSKQMVTNEFYGLLDTVRLLGHQDLGVIDIFKIDCEECEWDTFQDWLSDDIPLLHQILVEVHHAPKDKALDFYSSLERNGYLRFHKEPNIQWDPGCIEYAFVKVDEAFVEGKTGLW